MDDTINFIELTFLSETNRAILELYLHITDTGSLIKSRRELGPLLPRYRHIVQSEALQFFS